MGQSTFPVPSSGSSTSTVLPVNASSVILDGSLTSASTYTTTVNGNGGIAYLVASDNAAKFTIGGNSYTVPANSVSATSTVVGSSASVTIDGAGIGTGNPTPFIASTMPSSSAWSSVAYGLVGTTPTFVAVQNSGTSAGAYSTDGINWTAMTITAYASGVTSVIYGYNSFISVQGSISTSNTGAYSINGITWTGTTMPSARNWKSLAYGIVGTTPTYVAVQNTGATAGGYSYNGGSWTASTMPSSSQWYGVTYGNGYFVAVALNTTAGASSTNGTTWTARTMPSADSWYGVTYGLVGATPTYVAVANGTTAGAYSTNGTSWTASTMPSASWNGVTYGNGYFVAVAGSTVGAYSTNGTTWTSSTFPSASSWNGVAYGNGKFVAVASTTTTGAYYTFPAALPVNFGIYNGPTTIN